MSRKTLLIIIVLFFCIGVGFLGYYFLKPASVIEAPLDNSGVQNPFGNFFPSENVPTTPNVTMPEKETSTIQYSEPIRNLRKISDVPIAGGVVFDKTATSTAGTISNTIFRYVERATGHIYETTATSTASLRISNTTIPKIYEAFFLEDKNQVAFRYLGNDEKIETYVATIRATTTDEGVKTNLEGIFMQKDISDFSTSPNGRNIFVLSPNANSASAAQLLGQSALASNPNKQSTLFNSPIPVWSAEWFGGEQIAITSKPSYNAQGVLYFINSRTGFQEKILGPIPGLVTKPSPDGKKVLYSKNDGSGIATNFLTVSTNIIKSLPVGTIAEKCVWSRNNKDIFCAVPNSSLTGQYPDAWYMGVVSFNDSLIKIDTEQETIRTIMSIGAETTEPLDMINLQLSPKEDYLVFTNKRDLSFWSLDIKE